jgi:hypothetical protein
VNGEKHQILVYVFAGLCAGLARWVAVFTKKWCLCERETTVNQIATEAHEEDEHRRSVKQMPVINRFYLWFCFWF